MTSCIFSKMLVSEKIHKTNKLINALNIEKMVKARRTMKRKQSGHGMFNFMSRNKKTLPVASTVNVAPLGYNSQFVASNPMMARQRKPAMMTKTSLVAPPVNSVTVSKLHDMIENYVSLLKQAETNESAVEKLLKEDYIIGQYIEYKFFKPFMNSGNKLYKVSESIYSVDKLSTVDKIFEMIKILSTIAEASNNNLYGRTFSYLLHSLVVVYLSYFAESNDCKELLRNDANITTVYGIAANNLKGIEENIGSIRVNVYIKRNEMITLVRLVDKNIQSCKTTESEMSKYSAYMTRTGGVSRRNRRNKTKKNRKY